MMTRQQRLHAALTAAFSPVTLLAVVDDSAQHAGHSGATAGGETHYSVHIVSDRFAGLTRVARSRAAHEAVAAEFHDAVCTHLALNVANSWRNEPLARVK